MFLQLKFLNAHYMCYQTIYFFYEVNHLYEISRVIFSVPDICLFCYSCRLINGMRRCLLLFVDILTPISRPTTYVNFLPLYVSQEVYIQSKNKLQLQFEWLTNTGMFIFKYIKNIIKSIGLNKIENFTSKYKNNKIKSKVKNF